MTKQLVHAHYPVKGEEMTFHQTSSLLCNLFTQFIPLATLITFNFFQVNLFVQALFIPLVYLICGGRWTLGYHNLLHQLDSLNPLLDLILGSAFGHLLTFVPGKIGHDSHHFFNYGKDIRKFAIETRLGLEDERFPEMDYLTEEDVQYRMKQIVKKDADFWCKSSPNRWVLFVRSSQFDLNYARFCSNKKSEKKNSLAAMFMMRWALIMAPFLVLNPILYSIHLIMCRVIMAIIFMVFTTMAHEEKWFDSMVDKYYRIQNVLDINLFLEILIGYHVHHINEHDNHHIFPKRDVSILSSLNLSDMFKTYLFKHCVRIGNWAHFKIQPNHSSLAKPSILLNPCKYQHHILILHDSVSFKTEFKNQLLFKL